MAPGAKVRVYTTTDLGFAHLDQAYQTIINDLPSQPTLHQVSLSYGLGELYETTTQMETDAQYFASLAGSGVSVFVSSGDGGSTPGLNGYGDNSGPVQVECPVE
jgi:kumamolisin